MKGAGTLLFASGLAVGALAGWLLPGRNPLEVAPPPRAEPVAQAAPSPAPSPSRARERIEEIPTDHSGPEPLQDPAAARKEARANMLKGVLVLEVGDLTPERILDPWKDIEPERGTVRFSSDPERMAMNPWMTLYTIVPEEFEEALARSLDGSLRWVEPLHLAPEEVRAIREYTERAYRLMVDVQQRQAALRRMLADTGRYTPEERKALAEKSRGGGDLDHRIYIRSCEPGFRIPLLFSPEALK